MENKFKKASLFLIIFLVFLNIVIWSSAPKPKNDILSVHFLDVGQGDSIFIEAPNGKQLLIDGGRNGSFLSQLSRYMDISDREIDVVLATHPDADHIGGFPELFERFDVLNYVDPGSSSDTNLFKELKSKVSAEGSSYIKGERGLVIILDKEKGVYFQVLAPAPGFNTKDTNNSSIVGRLVYGSKSFLLTGDASKMIENILVYSDSEILDADVLKVGHHGSKTSSSLLFLEKSKPEISIISASAYNTYGHPHDDVMNNLKKVNSLILETSKEGTISFETNGTDLWRKQ
jgi:beta-lactamase superfamily II metal-dependent hydrolase